MKQAGSVERSGCLPSPAHGPEGSHQWAVAERVLGTADALIAERFLVDTRVKVCHLNPSQEEPCVQLLSPQPDLELLYEDWTRRMVDAIDEKHRELREGRITELSGRRRARSGEERRLWSNVVNDMEKKLKGRQSGDTT